MAKVPVIPAGLTQIGSDVGRVVDRAPPEQPHVMSCGDVGNVMPEVGTEAPHGFHLGVRVRKRKGSQWQGRVCGYYSTQLTQHGVCVESEREPGSVQIYPANALELIGPDE